MADHLAVVAKVTGRKIEDNSPVLPREARYLWTTFVSLHRARTSSGFGPNPITWTEIDAYCRLNGTALDPWEVEAVRALDDTYMSVAAEELEGAPHG